MKKFFLLLSTLLLILVIVPAVIQVSPLKVKASVDQCIPAPSGMVSWWPGDGNANDIQDSNNGSLQNGATFAPGKVSQAFSFDGVDDLLIVPDAPNLDIQNSFTFDAWVNLMQKYVRSSVLGRANNIEGYPGYRMGTDYSGEYYNCSIDIGLTEVNADSITSIIPGTFQHIACTFDGSVLRIYVNGNLESSVSTPPTPDIIDPLQIGGTGGLIDEVEVFNRALTASEIQAIFNAGSAGKCKPIIPTNTPTPVPNQPPSVASISATMDPVPVNTAINTNVNFTDPNTTDTHTAVWNWGDLTSSPGTVIETNGSGSVSGNHTYTTPGVYEINVTITDNYGASDQPDSPFQYLVVYDSSASGGFVTGAGVINSPIGAYTVIPSISGIARFGFVSKYQPGASIPTGDTQFRFQAAGFTFSSTSYQWLVVAGPQAKFKGEGTVTGNTHNHGFQLSATDGAINGGGGTDKFRIKIWDKDNFDTVIYDNNLGSGDNADPTTEINGGNIVIH